MEDGRWFSTKAKMLQLALKYFNNLFSTSKTGDDEQLFGLMKQRITTSMNNELLKPFTEDIGHVVKMMTPLKATGLMVFK